jgi:hypothetical protein
VLSSLPRPLFIVDNKNIHFEIIEMLNSNNGDLLSA